MADHFYLTLKWLDSSFTDVTFLAKMTPRGRASPHSNTHVVLLPMQGPERRRGKGRVEGGGATRGSRAACGRCVGWEGLTTPVTRARALYAQHGQVKDSIWEGRSPNFSFQGSRV